MSLFYYPFVSCVSVNNAVDIVLIQDESRNFNKAEENTCFDANLSMANTKTNLVIKVIDSRSSDHQ